jgi:NitT/TauT family transport system substrate-binding protein
MNRRDALRRAGWLAAAAVAGCKRKPSPLRRLRVALLPRFTLAPFYLADELGYFAEQGLEIEITPLAQAAQSLPVLAGGKVDVGFTSVTPGLVNAVARGARLKIVAGRDMAVPGCNTGGAVFASAKAFPKGLKDARKLRGKRVSLNDRVGMMSFFLDKILETAGMTQADLKIVQLQTTQGAAALIGGSLDALVAANLDKDLDLISNKVVRSVSMADLLPNFQYTFVLFGRTMIEGDRSMGVGFLEAYLRGVRDFQAGKDPKTFEKLAAAGHSDLTAVRSACRNSLTRDGRVDVASVKRMVDWAVRKGFSEKAPDLADLADNSWVEEANRRLERRGAR